MGDIVVGILLIALFAGIIRYLANSLRTRGTICTSCKSCALAKNCNADTVKNNILEFYKEQS